MVPFSVVFGSTIITLILLQTALSLNPPLITCDPSCLTCSGPGPNECLTCISGLLPFASACTCPDGTYYTGGLSSCQSCNPSCQTCNGGTSSDCLSCPTGYQIYQGICYPSCTSSQFFNTNNLSCSSCSSLCETCNGFSSNNCLSCDGGTLKNGTCTCSSGYYIATKGSCASCNTSCRECSGPNSNQCTSCPNNQVLTNLGTCTCPDGTYLHPTSKACVKCDATCKTCSDASSTQCITCQDNAFLTNGTCLCSSSFYLDQDTGNCTKCHQSCQSCNGPRNDQCESCIIEKTLKNGSCIDSCGQNEYKDANMSCRACDKTCKTCSGGDYNNCTSCESSFILNNGICANNKCSKGCTSCVSSSSLECTACRLGLVLVESAYDYGYCTAICPQDFYYFFENSKGKCRPKTQLVNGLAYGPDSDKILLVFDQDISPFFEELKNSIKVTIEFQSQQPKITYTYTLTLHTQKTILLSFTYSDHLLPRNILQVTYGSNSDNQSAIYVLDEVETIELLEYYRYSSGITDYTTSATKVAVIGAQANKFFSWTSSLVLQGVHSLRSEIVEDMIGYFIFMDVDYTPNFVAFANNGLNSFEIIMPNLFNNMLTQMSENEQRHNEGNSKTPPSSRLLVEKTPPKQTLMTKFQQKRRILDIENNQDAINKYLKSRSFLINHGAAITLILFVLAFLFLIEIIKLLSSKKSSMHKIWVILNKISISIRWNFLIAHFISEYQGFIFFSLVQFTNRKKASEPTDYLNLTFSVLGFLASISAIILTFFLANTIHKKLAIQKQTVSEDRKKIDHTLNRIAVLHNSFKHTRVVELLYPTAMVLRSFGFSITLVFAGSVPFIQIAYLLVTTIAIITYLVRCKPFKSKPEQIVTVIYEIMFLMIIIVTLALHVYNKDNLHDITNRTLVCLIILSLATSMFVLNMISLIVELFEFFKHLKKLKQILPLKRISLKTRVKKQKEVLNDKGNSNPSCSAFTLFSQGDIHNEGKPLTIGATATNPILQTSILQLSQQSPIHRLLEKKSLYENQGSASMGLLTRQTELADATPLEKKSIRLIIHEPKEDENTLEAAEDSAEEGFVLKRKPAHNSPKKFLARELLYNKLQIFVQEYHNQNSSIKSPRSLNIDLEGQKAGSSKLDDEDTMSLEEKKCKLNIHSLVDTDCATPNNQRVSPLHARKIRRSKFSKKIAELSICESSLVVEKKSEYQMQIYSARRALEKDNRSDDSESLNAMTTKNVQSSRSSTYLRRTDWLRVPKANISKEIVQANNDTLNVPE